MIARPVVQPYYPAFNSDELALLPRCPPPNIGAFSFSREAARLPQIYIQLLAFSVHTLRHLTRTKDDISWRQLLRCIIELKCGHLLKFIGKEFLSLFFTFFFFFAKATIQHFSFHYLMLKNNNNCIASWAYQARFTNAKCKH